MVRRIQQFLEVLFENTALHFLESPLFASPAVKCGSKLLAAKLFIVYYEPKVKRLGKFHIKFRVWWNPVKEKKWVIKTKKELRF